MFDMCFPPRPPLRWVQFCTFTLCSCRHNCTYKFLFIFRYRYLFPYRYICLYYTHTHTDTYINTYIHVICLETNLHFQNKCYGKTTYRKNKWYSIVEVFGVIKALENLIKDVNLLPSFPSLWFLSLVPWFTCFFCITSLCTLQLCFVLVLFLFWKL